jgi:hypothetical protein
MACGTRFPQLPANSWAGEDCSPRCFARSSGKSRLLQAFNQIDVGEEAAIAKIEFLAIARNRDGREVINARGIERPQLLLMVCTSAKPMARRRWKLSRAQQTGSAIAQRDGGGSRLFSRGRLLRHHHFAACVRIEQLRQGFARSQTLVGIFGQAR